MASFELEIFDSLCRWRYFCVTPALRWPLNSEFRKIYRICKLIAFMSGVTNPSKYFFGFSEIVFNVFNRYATFICDNILVYAKYLKNPVTLQIGAVSYKYTILTVFIGIFFRSSSVFLPS